LAGRFVGTPLQVILKLRRQDSKTLTAAPISSFALLPEQAPLGSGMQSCRSNNSSGGYSTFTAEDGDGYHDYDGFGRKTGQRQRDVAQRNVDGHDIDDAGDANDTDSNDPGQEDEGVPRASLGFEDLFDAPQAAAADRGRCIEGLGCAVSAEESID